MINLSSFLSSGLNNLIANARGANLLLLEGFVGPYELTIDLICPVNPKRLVFRYIYNFEWCPYINHFVH
jgi:hypothetical protein